MSFTCGLLDSLTYIVWINVSLLDKNWFIVMNGRNGSIWGNIREELTIGREEKKFIRCIFYYSLLSLVCCTVYYRISPLLSLFIGLVHSNPLLCNCDCVTQPCISLPMCPACVVPVRANIPCPTPCDSQSNVSYCRMNTYYMISIWVCSMCSERPHRRSTNGDYYSHHDTLSIYDYRSHNNSYTKEANSWALRGYRLDICIYIF